MKNASLLSFLCCCLLTYNTAKANLLDGTLWELEDNGTIYSMGFYQEHLYLASKTSSNDEDKWTMLSYPYQEAETEEGYIAFTTHADYSRIDFDIRTAYYIDFFNGVCSLDNQTGFIDIRNIVTGPVSYASQGTSYGMFQFKANDWVPDEVAETTRTTMLSFEPMTIKPFFCETDFSSNGFIIEFLPSGVVIDLQQNKKTVGSWQKFGHTVTVIFNEDFRNATNILMLTGCAFRAYWLVTQLEIMVFFYKEDPDYGALDTGSCM